MSDDRMVVSNLVKEFEVGATLSRKKDLFRAVDDVSFELQPGETLALVGESGCGKSTTARMSLGLIPPTSGSVSFGGADITKLKGSSAKDFRRKVQIVFQDPSGGLNPRKTAFRILRDPLLFHGLATKDDVREVAAEVVERVGLAPASSFLDRYPHQLSGGQRQRLVIARAISLEPRFIVADEPVSALDVSIRAQILELLKDLQRERRIGYLLITHDLAIVRSVAQRVAVMYLGRIVESGPVDQIFNSPQHPYTRALLAATPTPDPVAARRRKDELVLGEILSARSVSGGCRFQPRCPVSTEECLHTDPELAAYDAERSVACHVVSLPEPRPREKAATG